MAIILNFLKSENSFWGKFKIKSTSIIGDISSSFHLYLNPYTYLETTLSNVSYPQISLSLDYHNRSKMDGVMMYEVNYVISNKYLHDLIHPY